MAAIGAVLAFARWLLPSMLSSLRRHQREASYPFSAASIALASGPELAFKSATVFSSLAFSSTGKRHRLFLQRLQFAFRGF